jgi:hypothetical protein
MPVTGWQEYETVSAPRMKVKASHRINPMDWRGEPQGGRPGENTRPPAVFKHIDGHWVQDRVCNGNWGCSP